MNKILTKVLIVLIIFILVFEFSFSNTSFAAVELKDDDLTFISNLIGGIVSLIIWIPKLLTTALLWFFSNKILFAFATREGVSPEAGTLTTLTPFNIFFNHFKILDVNFFNIEAGTESHISYSIKTAVANWYYIMRNISAIILVIILIYVGIRMALSTVASDKVRYKKMLYDWLCSVLLIFVLHYIIRFIIGLNDAIVYMLSKMLGTEDTLGAALDQIVNQSLVGVGFTAIMAFLVYVIIIVQTILFLIAYINRFLKVGFLIMISPLISITYSIDKMGDGKAQALEGWLKELLYTILIQPFHCIMYMAFVSAAASLMVPGTVGDLGATLTSAIDPSVNQLTNGVLAILCLKFINDGEKVIRKIFNFQDDNSSTSMAAGAALAVMAVQKAKQAKSVGKSFAKSDLGKAAKRDFNKLTAKYGDFGNKMKKLENNFKSGKSFAGKLHRKITGAKGMKDKLFSKPGFRMASMMTKKSTAAVISAMGAAAMYATGSEGALESFAVGKRMYANRIQGMNLTKSSAAQRAGNSNTFLEDADRKDNEALIEDTTSRLQELNVSEADANDIEALGNAADKAEEEEMETRERVARKNRAEKIKKIDEQLNGMKNTDPKYKELQNKKKRLKEDPITEKELKEADSDEEVKKAREESIRAREIHSIATARAEAIKTRDEYDTPEARIARTKKRSRPISEKEFDTQKTRIAYLISQIKKQRELGEEENDTYLDGEIFEEPDDSSERTTQRLTDRIQHSVLTGSDFNVRDYMRDSLGITDFDDPQSLGYELMSAVQKYQYLSHQDNIAQSYKMASSAGATKDEHAERLVAASTGFGKPIEKKKNTKESSV